MRERTEALGVVWSNLPLAFAALHSAGRRDRPAFVLPVELTLDSLAATLARGWRAQPRSGSRVEDDGQ